MDSAPRSCPRTRKWRHQTRAFKFENLLRRTHIVVALLRTLRTGVVPRPMKAYATAGALLVAIAALASWAWEYLKRLDLESGSKTYSRLLEDTDTAREVPPPSVYEEASKSLSVVIPAFNEEDRLPPTLEETLRYLRSQRDRRGPLFTFEVIVVDDGSNDTTSRVATAVAQRHGFDTVRVLRLPQNKGKGYAVRSGVLVARGQKILFMDADGATSVSDVEKLEEELGRTASGSTSEPLGLVVGSRAHLEKEAIAKRHWYRNFLMRGFHFLVLFVAGASVRDTQCGFKLFTRRAARLLYTNQRLQRWCFDVELLFLARRLRVPVGEVAVNWTEIAGSKIKVTSIVHMSWELLAILLGYQVTRLWQIHAETPTISQKKRS